MTKKKIMMIGILIIGVLILIPVGKKVYNHMVDVYYYKNINGKDPIETVKHSIGVELPESAEVVQYYYDQKGGYYKVKLKIQSEDIDNLKKELLVFFNSEYTGGFAKGEIPNFENTADWWDLDYNTVESAYIYWTDKHEPRGSSWNWDKWISSIQNWAFISKDDMGQYYLYISSALEIEKYVPKKSRYELLDEE